MAAITTPIYIPTGLINCVYGTRALSADNITTDCVGIIMFAIPIANEKTMRVAFRTWTKSEWGPIDVPKIATALVAKTPITEDDSPEVEGIKNPKPRKTKNIKYVHSIGEAWSNIFAILAAKNKSSDDWLNTYGIPLAIPISNPTVSISFAPIQKVSKIFVGENLKIKEITIAEKAKSKINWGKSHSPGNLNPDNNQESHQWSLIVGLPKKVVQGTNIKNMKKKVPKKIPNAHFWRFSILLLSSSSISIVAFAQAISSLWVS